MANETLVELFKASEWATGTLFDACERLTEEQLEWAASGTFGTIKATLTHLVAPQERYVRTLTRQERPDAVREGNGFPGSDVLREHARWSAERLMGLAAQADPSDVRRYQFRGEMWATHAIVVLMQAIDHAKEHRTHIATVLGSHGVEPPGLDIWAYGTASGLQRRET